jgi:aspartate-semialdehyde dehydrogenase
MSRSSADLDRLTRVAVVGAQTTEGGRVRDALVEFGVPSARVDLYGATEGELVLSEYDGEARMIQQPDLADITRHEVIFICEPGELAGRVAAAAGDALVLDLLECLPPESGVRGVRLGDAAVAREEGRRLSVPHPLSLLLVELLLPIEREHGLEHVVAAAIRPAADFGEAGCEELREQTVRLLSFAAPPTETFGHQLAFNLIPQAELAELEPGLESRIAVEVTRLLDWTSRRLALSLVTAPLFHGHSVQINVRLRREASLENLHETLRAEALVGPADETPPATPLEVAETSGARVSRIAPDGAGGFWIWAVAGEAATRGARLAVQLAARLGAL